ncbi:MAG: hypothetical protein K2N26_03900, partial [Oscillospiraceae bacterium]|nr:hypothetical protein [Oscillospiraceae bacterium]
IEEIFKAAKRTAAFIGVCAAGFLLLAAAVEFLAGRACIRSEKINGNVYTTGKNADSKVVYVTNQPPVKFAINVIKRIFNG